LASQRDRFPDNLSIVFSIVIDHEFDATFAFDDRRLSVRRRPLPDRIVSAIAVQLQLHRLSEGVWQRLRAEHAGPRKRSSHSARRAEGMAPHFAEGRVGHVVVLRRPRRPALR
jgi:hypothetical protein